jgi:hypothetical protein
MHSKDGMRVRKNWIFWLVGVTGFSSLESGSRHIFHCLDKGGKGQSVSILQHFCPINQFTIGEESALILESKDDAIIISARR